MPQTRRILFSRAWKLYLKHHVTLKKNPKPYHYYGKWLNRFFKGRYIDTITYIDVQRYRAWREKWVSSSTVNREHSIITNLFIRLKRWNTMGIISRVTLPEYNPGSLVKKAPEPPRKRIVTGEEFRLLLRFSSPRFKRILLGAIATALRRKDLSLLRVDSENKATNCLEGIQAKTGKPYAIPINSILRKLIDTSEGPLLFWFQNARKEWDWIREKAELKDIQFRDLRRTAARFLLSRGADIQTVKDYLGHSSIAMTQAYTNPENKDRQKAGKVLEGFLR